MEEKAVALSPQVTKQDIDNWLFGSGTKLTEPQKALFYQISLAHNLNPAKREIYAIPYGSNFNVIVGYEVYLKRAERTGNLDWWEAGVKKEGQEYIGYCTIKRRDRAKETTIEAWFNEYNQNNNMWKTKPRTMIRKVAIAQAFRMVFPDELGGLPYTADEIETNGHVVDAQPQIIVDEKLGRIALLVKQLLEAGKLGNAEKFVGKPSSEWTDADIDKIEQAKKKKRATEVSESPTIDDQKQTHTQARVEMISDSQIDQIDELCRVKGVAPSACLPDGVDDFLALTKEQAQQVIENLARV